MNAWYHMLNCGFRLAMDVRNSDRWGEDGSSPSLGMICEDLVATHFVLRESERRGIGTLTEW